MFPKLTQFFFFPFSLIMYLFCLQSMRDVVTVGEELRPHRSIPDPTKVVPPSKKLSQVKQEPSLNGHFCCDEYKCGFIWLLVFFSFDMGLIFLLQFVLSYVKQIMCLIKCLKETCIMICWTLLLHCL